MARALFLLALLGHVTVSWTFDHSRMPSCNKHSNNLPSSPREQQVYEGAINTTVLCDVQLNGGGWILMQRRTTGDVSFYRQYADYKNGFGSLTTDYWLGLKHVHRFTSHGDWELRIDVFDNGRWYHVIWSDFEIKSESQGFRLHISGSHSGNLEDGNNIGISYSSGKKFSTHDRVNECRSDATCARDQQGGWWYSATNFCTKANLNGSWGTRRFFWIANGFNRWITKSIMRMRIKQVVN